MGNEIVVVAAADAGAVAAVSVAAADGERTT